jgi:hypothetical protein
MANHDDLLAQGPREAPEPETAEQKSRKLGLKTAGGAVAGGGIAAAKLGAIGGLGKFFLWIAAWNAFRSGWYYGGWIGLAVGLVAIVLVVIAVERREKR